MNIMIIQIIQCGLAVLIEFAIWGSIFTLLKVFIPKRKNHFKFSIIIFFIFNIFMILNEYMLRY